MTIRVRFPMLLSILVLLVFSAFGSTAAAAPPVAKDGKIHACYKAKGKGKGTLRLVGNGKVRCPRKWKKVAWYANAPSALPVQGAQGEPGPPGPQGERGLTGAAGNVVVEELENKVSELLTKVTNLESALANLAGLEAVVGSLCTQTETLTDQLNALEDVVGGIKLNTILAVLLEIPVLPGALPSYNCPTL
jgi:hypothetical protein